jgi:NADH:ubiquinone oxidoreductase subunit B-like Fe-S oxidoreductase
MSHTRNGHPPKYLLMKNPYDLDAECIQLFPSDMLKILIAVGACVKSGGGGSMYSLQRKLETMIPRPEGFDEAVYTVQVGIALEVYEVMKEELAAANAERHSEMTEH